MNLYSGEELDRINKIKETNDKLEEFFNDKRNEWNKNVDPLFKVLTVDLSNPSNFKLILEAQSTSLTFKQMINENINYFLNKRSRETTKIKKLRQDKFIFYATSFGVKTNMGEKTILIDAHIAENDRSIELIESYITFLRDTNKNLEAFGFTIKNMTELLNYLGR